MHMKLVVYVAHIAISHFGDGDGGGGVNGPGSDGSVRFVFNLSRKQTMLRTTINRERIRSCASSTSTTAPATITRQSARRTTGHGQ